MLKYDFENLKTAKDKRLALEHLNVERLSKNSSKISYQISGKFDETNPPSSYIITYHLKSIIGIKDDLYPIYGKKHLLEIVMPENYPETAIKYKIISKIWHPNIIPSGKSKGHISKFDTLFKRLKLDNLILWIGGLLQYKYYYAEDETPSPENIGAAKWIRDFAEPLNIVNHTLMVALDPSLLVDQEYKTKIRISKI